ncbi:MAG: hypothetical protein AAGG68_30510 [Bacteroidota bacterium]
MNTDFVAPPRPKQKAKVENKKPKKKKNSWLIWAIALTAMAGTFKEYVIERSDGSYELKPERQEKLEKALEDLDEAEQYALVAKKNAYYPCFNCGDEKEVYLYMGEVWKYGFTTKKNRYSDPDLIKRNLRYVPQYIGTLVDCMKEERRKIYNYPLLPENLKRSFKLPRPPGNKQDN